MFPVIPDRTVTVRWGPSRTPQRSVWFIRHLLNSNVMDVGLLVMMIWLELCTNYSSSSPVVTTTSIILCFNEHRLTRVHLENGRLNGERVTIILRGSAALAEVCALLSAILIAFDSSFLAAIVGRGDNIRHKPSTYSIYGCYLTDPFSEDYSGSVSPKGIIRKNPWDGWSRVFFRYRPDALPVSQSTVSKHRRDKAHHRGFETNQAVKVIETGCRWVRHRTRTTQSKRWLADRKTDTKQRTVRGTHKQRVRLICCPGLLQHCLEVERLKSSAVAFVELALKFYPAISTNNNIKLSKKNTTDAYCVRIIR